MSSKTRSECVQLDLQSKINKIKYIIEIRPEKCQTNGEKQLNAFVML